MSVNEDTLQALLDSNQEQSHSLEEDVTPEVELPQVQFIASPIIEEADSLSRIIATRKQIVDVKKSLCGIVDSIAENPSLFTRASSVWGQWPIWQKIGSGIVLTVPAILVGVAANISSLLVIGGTTGVIYSAAGMVLEDHHACNVSIKQRLKDGILCIADVLELTIVALDAIRVRLTEEVEKFKIENDKLANHIVDLGAQVQTLTNQVEIFVETERLLRVSKEKLEASTALLQNSVSEQNELLAKSKEELAAVTRDYQHNQRNLEAQVAELQKARLIMDREVEKAQKVAAGLKKTVDTLSGAVIEDQEQRKGFQSKLENFLSGREVSFSKVAESMVDTERDLQTAKTDLSTSNLRYQQLLAQQEKLILRLEALDVSIAASKSIDKEHGSVLSHSLFHSSSQRKSGVVGDKPTVTTGMTV